MTKHVAHSNRRLPNRDDWVAFNARIEVMQDVVAALKVSPCCTDDDVLLTVADIESQLYDLRDLADVTNEDE